MELRRQLASTRQLSWGLPVAARRGRAEMGYCLAVCRATPPAGLDKTAVVGLAGNARLRKKALRLEAGRLVRNGANCFGL